MLFPMVTNIKVTTDPTVYQANPNDTALLTLKNGGTSFELFIADQYRDQNFYV